MTLMRIALLISFFSTGICAAQAPIACPWLSTGSAAVALGGAVTLSAHVESNQQGMCGFSRESDGKVKVLEITIGKEDTHPCPLGSAKLSGLGNEALQCKNSKANGLCLDVIAGRMRDVYFVVSIGNVPDAASVPPATERPFDPYGASLLERVAEQVVGNIY
jgi:hypothetical protein